MSGSLRVVADAGALAVTAAEVVAGHAARALAARGAFRFAVPGGRSPRGMLAALAAAPHREALDWSRVTVLFADERALPPDIAEGKFGFFSREAVSRLAIPETDRSALWPVYDRYHDRFVALRADCAPGKPVAVHVEEITPRHSGLNT